MTSEVPRSRPVYDMPVSNAAYLISVGAVDGISQNKHIDLFVIPIEIH